MNNALLDTIVVLASILGFLIFVILLRLYMQGGKYKRENRIDDKVVIITGANCGIGKETARELARRGATVYMACRDMQKAEEACTEIKEETGNAKVYCLHLDLSSLASVREFVKIFKSQQNRLDILINNAGVMFCPLMRTKDGFEMQLGVNHLGHFLLTNLLLDLLKESAPSRIIAVSSLAHKYGRINVNDLNSEKSYNRQDAYSQSKLANILFTKHLSRLLTGCGVTVNALHPGVVDTNLARHISFLNNCLGRFLFRPFFWPFVKTPKNGAQTTLFAALDPHLELVSGVYFSDCKVKKVAKRARDSAMAEWLWRESVKFTEHDTSNIRMLYNTEQ